MAAPWKIGTTTLERKGSLTVMAKRGIREEITFEQHCIDWVTTVTTHQSAGFQTAGTIALLKAGALNDELASVSLGWTWDIEENPEDPEEPPNCGTENGSAPDVANIFRLYNSQSATCKGKTPVSDTDNLALTRNFGKFFGTYFHSGVDGGLSAAVAFEESATVTLEASVDVDIMADLTKIAAEDLEDWEDFVQDHDPYGEVSQELGIYYVPTGNVAITVSGPCGNHSWTVSASDFASQAEFEEYFRWGLGAMVLSASPTAGLQSEPGWDSVETCASGKIEGTGLVGGSQTTQSFAADNYPQITTSYNPSTGDWSAKFDGSEISSYSPSVTVMKGAFEVPYTGIGSDFDGVTRAGTIMTVDWNEGEQEDPHTCPLNGSATFESSGSWVLSWGGTLENPIRLVVADYNTAGSEYDSTYDAWTMHGTANKFSTPPDDSHYGGLLHLDDLGEPQFPAPVGDDTRWFDDTRVETEPGQSGLQWDDAIVFTIADEVTAAELDNVDDWAITGGATIERVNLGSVGEPDWRLHVTVTSAASLAKTFAGSLIGARYGELSYTSDDTESIGLEIAGKTWSVSPSAKTFDLLGPSATALADKVQSCPSSSPNASWGVHAVGTLKLTGLRAGKQYWFAWLNGKRPTTDKAAEAQVFSEGFLGKEQSGMDSDAFTKPEGLALYIDGVCAGTWAGGLVEDLETGLTPGEGGLVSLSVNDHADWRQGSEAEGYYMVPGIYPISGQTITVPVRMKAARILMPLCWGGSYAMRMVKRLRGVINCTLVSSTGVGGARDGSIEQRHTSGGSVVATIPVRTNAHGWVRTTALQQPIHAHDNLYRLKTLKVDASYATLDLDVRNRYGTRAVIYDSLAAPASGKGSAAVYARSHRTYVADTRADGTHILIYNHESKAKTDRLATANVGLTGVGLTWRESRKDELVLVYDSAGAVMRMTSKNEARTWSTPVSIASGTRPSVAAGGPGPIEMLAYINSAGNKVCVRRKLGTKDYGAEIEVASASSTDTTALVHLSGERKGAWVLFLGTSSGIKRYKSANNGRTWSLDE